MSKSKSCPRRSELSEIQRLMIYDEMFKQGIVPIEAATNDIRRAFVGTDEDEAKASKRKFRKMWRKLARKEASLSSGAGRYGDLISKKVVEAFGLGAPKPTRSQCFQRKQAVLTNIWNEQIAPRLEALEAENDGSVK